MAINKNYNSNMYCCINNKQLIKLFTPNYSKVLTNLIICFVYSVYNESCICRGPPPPRPP